MHLLTFLIMILVSCASDETFTNLNQLVHLYYYAIINITV